MHPSRFDRWTRSLATLSTRRSTLRSLAALGTLVFGGRSLAVPPTARASACAGFGCPCKHDGNCVEGLVCCGNSCSTSGNCGYFCTGNGDACPASCSLGEPCADCCGGFCAAYGGCTTIYYSQAGGACSLADPTACAPGLTCCPARHSHGEGVCQDSC